MPGVYFFAVREDHHALLDFIFAETDFHVTERSSHGRPLREFKSFGELAAVYDVGQDKYGNGSITLSLWSPNVMPKAPVRRIKLDPKYCDGLTFGYAMDGAGVAFLELGGLHGRIITKSHFNHFSEKGAAKWGQASGINWKAMSKLSNRIRYHISKRLEVAHVPGTSILPGAYKLHLKGYQLKWSAAGTLTYWIGDN
jgi:hypothetical protein